MAETGTYHSGTGVPDRPPSVAWRAGDGLLVILRPAVRTEIRPLEWQAPVLQRLASPRNVVTLAVAMLLCYLGIWLGYDHAQRVHSDFAGFYFASWLLKEGHRADLYDPAVQRWAHDLLVGPLPPNMTFTPFVNLPIAAVITIPLTLLSPVAADIVWSPLQVAVFAAAVVIAYRSAPRPSKRTGLETAAILLLVLSAYASFDLLRSGLWDGVIALGVAMAYRSWRRERFATGGVWIVATLGITKPHLAIGLIAFLVGWGNRRAIAGALATGVAVGAASIALVGASGLKALVPLLGSDAHVLSIRGQSSVAALAANWTADGRLTFPIAYVGTCLLAGLCFLLGLRLRRGRVALGPALATATFLSLLAAPHSFVYDTVMIAPAIAWLLAEHSPFSLDPATRRRGWATALLWHAATSTLFLNQMISPTILRVGTPILFLEAGLAVYLWRTANSGGRGKGRETPARALAAAGPIATAP